MRPLQGPTILEMQEPEHAIYRNCTNSLSPVLDEALGRRTRGPLVDRRSRSSAMTSMSTWSMRSSCRSRCGSLRPFWVAGVRYRRFHRLAIDLLGFRGDMEAAMEASGEMKDYFVGILADDVKSPKDDMVTILPQPR